LRIGAAEVGILTASIISFVAACYLVAFAFHAITKSLSTPTRAALCAVLVLPLTGWASSELLSGGSVSTLKGILIVRVLLTVLLALAAASSVILLQWVRSLEGGRAKLASGAVAGCGVLFATYADAHFQVGHYPAFHYILLAMALLAAVVLANVAALCLSIRGRAGSSVTAVLVLISAGGTWYTADTLQAMSLANYSTGTYPKVREIAIATTGVISSRLLASGGPSVPAISDTAFDFEPTSHQAAGRVRSETKNVVFILTDAFRNDHVGGPRGQEGDMPFWKSWESEAVRFVNAYAPSDHTGRSMPSIMTSLPLGVVQLASELGIPLTTWMDHLRAAGFRTFANGRCDYLDEKRRFIRVRPCMGAEYCSPGSKSGDQAVDEIIQFVLGDRERPFAVYTHWMDTHIRPGWDPVGRYRQAVRLIDQRIEYLVSRLREIGAYEHTLIIWTADHGYGLGEGNRFLGRHGVIERQLRIPLVMRIPGLASKEGPFHEIVSNLAVAPTVFDLLLPDVRALVGAQSLLPVLLDWGPTPGDERRVAFSSTGREHMIRAGSLKLRVDARKSTALLFDLSEDPDEKSPLNSPVQMDEMQGLLRKEFERQSALSLKISDGFLGGLPQDVARLILTEEPDEDELRSAVRGFWSWGPEARRFLLRKSVERRFPIKRELRGLTRDEWEDDDQLLLVIRSVIGDESACEQMHARISELGPEGIFWFASYSHRLPEKCASLMYDTLLAHLRVTKDSDHPVGSMEEKTRTLLAAGFAYRMREDTPRELKEFLVALYNRHDAEKQKYTFATPAKLNFGTGDLLAAMERSVTNDDLGLLRALSPSRDALKFTARACKRIQTTECNQLLLDLIGDPSNSYHWILAMVPTLEDFEDEEFRAHAIELIREISPER